MLPNCRLRLTRFIFRLILELFETGEFSLNRGLFFLCGYLKHWRSVVFSGTLLLKECRTGRLTSIGQLSYEFDRDYIYRSLTKFEITHVLITLIFTFSKGSTTLLRSLQVVFEWHNFFNPLSTWCDKPKSTNKNLKKNNKIFSIQKRRS